MYGECGFDLCYVLDTFAGCFDSCVIFCNHRIGIVDCFF